jgi:hypothetical protein
VTAGLLCLKSETKQWSSDPVGRATHFFSQALQTILTNVLFMLVLVNRIIHRTRISPFETWHVGFSLDGLILNKSIYVNYIKYTKLVRSFGASYCFFGVRRRPIQANSPWREARLKKQGRRHRPPCSHSPRACVQMVEPIFPV